MKYPLSAVVLTRNEETKIGKCLDSIDFCKEIVVIDDLSKDKTIEIAKKKGAKVISHEINGNFAKQRNYGLFKAAFQWILYVDADEIISEELKKNIINVISKEEIEGISAYYIKRRDFWRGREMKFGETKKVRNKGLIRLIKKDSGKWLGNVHEVFYTVRNSGSLNGFIDHYPHPTIKEFLQDINGYSTLRAKELFGHGINSGVISMIIYPFSKFLLNYFINQGFRDGPAGFVYAFMMSFHSFLVRAKLYQFNIESS